MAAGWKVFLRLYVPYHKDFWGCRYSPTVKTETSETTKNIKKKTIKFSKSRGITGVI